MASRERFAAFLDGIPFYIDLERPCGKCGNFKKRVRDRSCYACHLGRSEENFERIRAGIAPKANRSMDGHLDLLQRKRAEREGEHQERSFGALVARRWPLGRLEVIFPDGYAEHDLSRLSYHGLCQAIAEFPALRDALIWAGWTVPYDAGG